MNDHLRFRYRAWNWGNINPEMIYDVQKLNGYDHDCYTRKDIEKLSNTWRDIVMNRRDFQNIIDTPAYTIMESIALIDKKGKLIYEGDIIHLECGDDKIKCPVIRDTTRASFSLQHKKGYHGQYGLDDKIIGVCDRFEIIGNIYENKDLLEVENG
tara:strand:+ start:10020 stop:10484 length:465 start_codon:yes stop_codon:yes gene_type:complete